MFTRFSRALCALAPRALATRALATRALAALALGALPLAAHAADIDKDARAKGMKEAPAAVQKAGLTCTLTDAYFVGRVDTKTGGSQDAYEVACQEGGGYVVLTSAKETKSYDCLATAGQSLACKLPANADPTGSIKPVIASAGLACTPTKARWIGSSTKDGAPINIYETACQQGPGYVLEAPVPGAATAQAAVQVIPCNQLTPGGKVSCTLTSKAQSDAALAAMVQSAGHRCQVSASRYVGSDKTGQNYTEVGCGADPGYVLAMAKNGAFVRAMTCSEAKAYGGCTLTDPAKVAASESADYSAKLASAGFPCQVSKSRTIGTDTAANTTIVEVACSNRSDGAIAVFPNTAAGKVKVLDCVEGGQYGAGAACTLTQPTALYAKYTQELGAKNGSTCQVSNAKWLAGAGSSNYIETACAGGKPGFVLQLSRTDEILDIMSCGQAKASGVSCTLPTNLNR